MSQKVYQRSVGEVTGVSIFVDSWGVQSPESKRQVRRYIRASEVSWRQVGSVWSWGVTVTVTL